MRPGPAIYSTESGTRRPRTDVDKLATIVVECIPTGLVGYPRDHVPRRPSARQPVSAFHARGIGDPSGRALVLRTEPWRSRVSALSDSQGGVHILEDRGFACHNFGNRGGGYSTRYADFIAATQGRVEAVSIAVNRWHGGGLRLCVGRRKPTRVDIRTGESHRIFRNEFRACVLRRRYWAGKVGRVAPRSILTTACAGLTSTFVAPPAAFRESATLAPGPPGR